MLFQAINVSRKGFMAKRKLFCFSRLALAIFPPQAGHKPRPLSSLPSRLSVPPVQVVAQGIAVFPKTGPFSCGHDKHQIPRP